ncbi:MAG: YDG domain-containing protein [Bacteroidia bacterium]|jgi:hypothetical protein|nr:YDG domain-containing protein [Bacteroidia bacterium]
MKNLYFIKVLCLLLLICIGKNSVGQTTLFSDNFSTSRGTTYTTTVGAIGSDANWLISRSGSDMGARIDGGILDLTNDASATSNANGWVFGYRDINSLSGWNTTLSSNTGTVSWEFNMRQIRTDPAGFGAGSYGVAFVLASTNTTVSTSGSGYAVVLGQSGSTDAIRLIHFNNGLQGTSTNIISSNTTGLTDFGNEYLSVRVTYIPSSNTWELFLRNDGTTTFTDPTGGTALTSQGTANNSTYTSTSGMRYIGGYWQGSTAANQTAFFDNVYLKVTSASSATITGTATTSAFTTTYGTASAAQQFSISGSNLTANLIATAPTGFQVSNDGTNFGTTATFNQTSGNASGTLHIRLAATATVGNYNNMQIVLSSTGATSVNITTPISGNTVTAATITITGLTASNKDFDGTTTVSVTGIPSYNGLVNSESFSVTGSVTWAFPDANVGNNKTLIRTGNYNAPSTNYTVIQPTLTANISATIPGAPNITNITNGNGEVTVIFNTPTSNGGSAITNYKYSTDNGLNYIALSPNVTTSPLIITGLTNNTTYQIKIRAINAIGDGAESNMIQATPTNNTPPSVNISSATGITSTAATLNGEVTNEGSVSVTDRGFVYNTTSGVTIANNKTQSGSGLGSFSITPTLTVNTQYYFKSYAINSAGTTLSTELNFWTLANIPTAPIVNSPSATTLNIAIGNSDGNPNNTTYAIRENNSGNFVQINGSLGVTEIWQTAATWGTITITGLSSSTSYTFSVKARNGNDVETSYGSNTSASTSASIVTIAGWNFDGLTGAGASPQNANTIASNVSITGLTRASALGNSGSPASNAWGSTVNVTGLSDASAAINANSFITFTVKANSGYLISLNEISTYNIRRSVSGPTSGQWQYSIDGTTFTNIGTTITWGSTTNAAGNAQTAINLSGITALQNVSVNTTITFRCIIWGASGASGTWYFNEFQTGNDLIVRGTVEVNTSPFIEVSTTQLSGFTQLTSAPSNEQSFVISGSNLTTDVTITPTTGYEISTSTGVSFSATNPLTLNVSNGNITGQPITIYIRQNSNTFGINTGIISHTSVGTNNPNISVSGQRNGTYYSKASGDLNELNTWGTNSDGSGTSPNNFTTNGIIYEIRNRGNATINANWTVSGTNSKVVVGDGTNNTDFTIPANFSLSGTIDVSNEAELTIENTTSPTIGTLANGSTIEYNNIAITLSNLITYRNLKLTGSGTKTFPINNTTITGNLIFDNITFNGAGANPFSTILLGGNLTYIGSITPPTDANVITLSTNGTAGGTQTFTGAGNTLRWFRITTTTANTILLSTTGGSSHLSLGNNSGGGVSLVDGSILNLNGNDFTLFNSNSTSNAFILNNTGSISATANSDFILSRIGNGNLGTIRFTDNASTIGNLTLNHTGVTNRRLDLGSSLTITGTLTLTSGTLLVGTNTLTLSGDVVRTNGVIDASNTSAVVTFGGTNALNLSPNFFTGNLNNVTVNKTTGVILDQSLTVANDLILTEGFLDISNYSLTINGGVTRTNGSIRTNGGEIIIGGGSQNISLHFDQTQLGVTNLLQNLTINRNASTITLANPLRVSGTITPTSGTLNANGNLLLVSTSSGTGRIAQIQTGADITGNVTVQRFIQGGAGFRGWRLIASPTSGFGLTQLMDNIFVTGPGGITNGFDAATSTSSILTYQENTTGGRGWKNISNINASINTTSGMFMFFRGDRSQTASLTNASIIPNATQLHFTGNINKGSINTNPVNLSYTNTGNVSGDGFNLLGNPYPCEINYGSITKTSGVSNTFWTWNPATGNYVNLTSANDIAIGQGFFVQVNSSSESITFEENNKTASSPTAYFKTQTEPFNIKMYIDSNRFDVAWLSFNNGASSHYLFNEDAVKMQNSIFNLAFVTSNQVQMQRNVVNELSLNSSDSFVINARSTQSGNYWLSFENSNELPTNKNVYLLDLFNNNWIDIKNVNTYSFTINNGNPLTFGNRFILIITDVVAALPVNMIHFTASAKENMHCIEWKTADEHNINHYEIQQSFDGKSFTSIGLIKANNSKLIQHYQYKTHAVIGKVYYRMKIVEFNPSIQAYTKTVVIDDYATTNFYRMFPNPANDWVTIEFYSNEDVPQTITILNLAGEIIETIYGDKNRFVFSIKQYNNGVYLVRLPNGQLSKLVVH